MDIHCRQKCTLLELTTISWQWMTINFNVAGSFLLKWNEVKNSIQDHIVILQQLTTKADCANDLYQHTNMINSLALGRCSSNFKSIIFKLIIPIGHLQRNSSKVNATEPHHWEVKISVDKDLGLSGYKLLPEPMLTPLCRHMASLGRS